MTINKIVKDIYKKDPLNILDNSTINMVLNILSDLIFEQFIINKWNMDQQSDGIDAALYNHGEKRLKQRAKRILIDAKKMARKRK